MVEQISRTSYDDENREDMIDRLKKMPYQLENPKTAKTDLLLKVILVGDSSVGKSALMHRITQNEFI